MNKEFLQNSITLFLYYKSIGEKAIQQIPEDQLFWQFNKESNSVATIIKHLHGNMLSRWTDFLNSDGEKEWRQRDGEFENDIKTKEEMMRHWEDGWSCLFKALDNLQPGDLLKTAYIRNMGRPAFEVITRQLTHYASHIGQMIYIGKMILGEKWVSLSIPKGKSAEFNKSHFSKEKRNRNFTDDFSVKKK